MAKTDFVINNPADQQSGGIVILNYSDLVHSVCLSCTMSIPWNGAAKTTLKLTSVEFSLLL